MHIPSSTSSMPSKISTLLSWCKSQGIEIDDRVVLEETQHSGIAVMAGDALIPCDTIREWLLSSVLGAYVEDYLEWTGTFFSL
jgi:hypothetical protein